MSNARPGLFAYPTSIKPPKKETVTKVATAVLSTTAKVKAREKKKLVAEGDTMDLVSPDFLVMDCGVTEPRTTQKTKRKVNQKWKLKNHRLLKTGISRQ